MLNFRHFGHTKLRAPERIKLNPSFRSDGNSPTVIAAAITSRMSKTHLPTHIDIYADKAGLAKDSVVLLEQVRTLDKRRLKEKMGHLDDEVMQVVNSAIAVSFGLDGGTAAREGAAKSEEQEPNINIG